MEPDSVHSGSELERRYRHLLRVFPRGYRARRGDEMMGTLLETATPGQRRPSRTDTVDILTGALRERLGINAVPGFGTGLRIAGPINLVLATGFALLLWRSFAPPPMSTVVGVAWLPAVAVQLVAPRWLAWAVLVAWLATLAAAITAVVGGAAAPFWVDFGGSASGGPPGGPDQTYLTFASVRAVIFTGQLVCGLIALVAAGTVHWRPSWAERIPVVLAAVGLPGLTLLRSAWSTWPSGISPLWTYGLILLPIGILIFGAVMAVTRRSTGGLWAALLAYVGVTAVADGAPTFLAAGGSLTLVQLDPRTLFGHDGVIGVWGLLFPLAGPEGTFLLGAVVVVAVCVAAARSVAGGGNCLATLGGIALGTTAGVSLYELASMWKSGGASPRDILIAASPAVAAIAVPFVPRWLRRPIILMALGTILASVYSDRLGEQHSVLALVLLLVIAAVSVRASAALVGASAVGALALVAFIAWFILADIWSDPFGAVQDTAIPAVAALVLVVAPVAAIIAVLHRRGSWISGALVFVAGVTGAVSTVVTGPVRVAFRLHRTPMAASATPPPRPAAAKPQPDLHSAGACRPRFVSPGRTSEILHLLTFQTDHHPGRRPAHRDHASESRRKEGGSCPPALAARRPSPRRSVPARPGAGTARSARRPASARSRPAAAGASWRS